MGQPIIQPSRVRRVFNGWSHGLFAGQQFQHVLNLGCGHDQDHEGYTYSGYWDAIKTTRVDISDHTEYGDYQVPVVGAAKFTNPDHAYCNAEDLSELSKFHKVEYDMVFANWMVYQLNWRKVILEIHNVLIPRGKILITYMDEGRYGSIYTYIKTMFTEIAYCYLKMDNDLDGRDWVAEGIWGAKK